MSKDLWCSKAAYLFLVTESKMNHQSFLSLVSELSFYEFKRYELLSASKEVHCRCRSDILPLYPTNFFERFRNYEKYELHTMSRVVSRRKASLEDLSTYV
jgi:hypothetical protein